MDDAVRMKDYEFAEMELRILVALYDAWPDARAVIAEAIRPVTGRAAAVRDELRG